MSWIFWYALGSASQSSIDAATGPVSYGMTQGERYLTFSVMAASVLPACLVLRWIDRWLDKHMPKEAQ